MQETVSTSLCKWLAGLIVISLVLLIPRLTVAQNSQRSSSTPTSQSRTTTPTKINTITTETGNTNPTAATPPEIFKVTISPSRVSVTRDGSYGVFADLENLSSDVVSIKAAQTMLVIQPEVAQPNACVESKRGIFPARFQTTENNLETAEIQIQPKEHYKVFWDLTNSEQSKKESQKS